MHDTAAAAEISGGHDVVESTCVVASDVPMYDPLIVPTLPISLDDFKHHVTNCHLNDDKEFDDQYQVELIFCYIRTFLAYTSFAC